MAIAVINRSVISSMREGVAIGRLSAPALLSPTIPPYRRSVRLSAHRNQWTTEIGIPCYDRINSRRMVFSQDHYAGTMISR